MPDNGKSRRAIVIDTIDHRPSIMPSHENFQDTTTREKLVPNFDTGCWYVNWLLYSEYMDNYLIELHPFPGQVEMLEENSNYIVQRLYSGVIRKIQKSPGSWNFTSIQFRHRLMYKKWRCLIQTNPA